MTTRRLGSGTEPDEPDREALGSLQTHHPQAVDESFADPKSELGPQRPTPPSPGKQTAVERTYGGYGRGLRSNVGSGPRTRVPGKRTRVQSAYPVQRRGPSGGGPAVHAAAERGIATPSAALPRAARIQESFGRHDVSLIQAHLGDDAAASASEMGAHGYATGNHVVLGRGTDLFTEAHEAAHVVQQRGGVELRGGVGEAGDAHERHADEVAARVVQGRSAEDLLDRFIGSSDRTQAHGAAAGIQLQAPASASSAAWPDGPTVARKSVDHTLAEYLVWLRQVEARFGAGRAETLQRLRRLYYSNFTGGAGPRFDAVIKDVPGARGAPMTTADLPLATINGLYETNAITTPNGSLIDASHILAGLDVHVQGGGLKAGVGEIRFDVDFEGVLTWVGDLASWFVESKNAVKQKQAATGGPVSLTEQMTILLALVDNKASKDDLLGDFDAQVMSDKFTTTTVMPTISEGPPVIITRQDIPLSEMLIRYYGGERPAGGAPGSEIGAAGAAGPRSSNRFHYFVAGARPRIPHRRVSERPLQVSLGADAAAQTREHIHNTARMFIDQGYLGSSPRDLEIFANLLDEVNARFVRFLKTGLASGDAPWP